MQTKSANPMDGELVGSGVSIAIVVSRFNESITERLLEAAQDTLRRHGVEQIEVLRVPGAFELPLAARMLAKRGKCDAIVALGAVIRGATPHFEYVSGECTRGLGQVQLEFEIPIGFGVLTVNSVEQAVERAGAKAGNKGTDAALAALEMVNLLAEVRA